VDRERHERESTSAVYTKAAEMKEGPSKENPKTKCCHQRFEMVSEKTSSSPPIRIFAVKKLRVTARKVA